MTIAKKKTTAKKPTGPLRPLSKPHEKFVDSMVHFGEPKKAAIDAGYNAKGYRHLLKNDRILAEIDRRKDMVQVEKAKITANRQIVQKDALDEALMTVVQADIKKQPTLAPSKVRAIELGYERIGVSVEGVFIPEGPTTAAQSPTQDEQPRIFRATETKMLTHSIETIQKVTTREVIAAPPVSPLTPPPAPDKPVSNYRF